MTITERLDRLQRRHPVLGFAVAVGRKYADDGGGREAALITYYGFLSVFPSLLLGVAAVSFLLRNRPRLRQELVTAMVPPALRPTVLDALAALPSSRPALLVGLAGLLLAGAGVVSSAYRTLNHVAAVPYHRRHGLVSRYARVLAALVVILTGAVAAGGLTVAAAAVPELPQLSRAGAVVGSCAVVCTALILVARLLLARPAPLRALWPAALPAAAVVTLALNLGATVLPALVRRAGPVYGAFATVAGMFTLLSVLSLTLVCAAEVAAVRYARLWPRALVPTRPTPADRRALELLTRELSSATGDVPPAPAPRSSEDG